MLTTSKVNWLGSRARVEQTRLSYLLADASSKGEVQRDEVFLCALHHQKWRRVAIDEMGEG
jgi:hypothetical protein